MNKRATEVCSLICKVKKICDALEIIVAELEDNPDQEAADALEDLVGSLEQALVSARVA